MDVVDIVLSPVRIGSSGEVFDLRGEIDIDGGATLTLAGTPTYRLLQPDLTTEQDSGDVDVSEGDGTDAVISAKSIDVSTLDGITGNWIGEIYQEAEGSDGRTRKRLTRNIIPVRT